MLGTIFGIQKEVGWIDAARRLAVTSRIRCTQHFNINVRKIFHEKWLLNAQRCNVLLRFSSRQKGVNRHCRSQKFMLNFRPSAMVDKLLWKKNGKKKHNLSNLHSNISKRQWLVAAFLHTSYYFKRGIFVVFRTNCIRIIRTRTNRGLPVLTTMPYGHYTFS